jgi:hypothetical protein
MRIELREITIREVTDGYVNSDEDGVVAYSGLLNVRPKYQREFIYKDKQRDAVINTVRKAFPLNIMYWVQNQDGTFEVLDGQQRTISICEYVTGKYSINSEYFHTLTDEEKTAILDYRILVYFCEGSDREKLDWFKTINIAGEKLTDQELRNAIYTGPWLTDAKRHFSKTGCAAYNLASDYLTGVAIRQDYLETVIDWISNGNIEQYMADHQNVANANELWLYFNSVITWVKAIFPNYRREMKSVAWGKLYNSYKDVPQDQAALEQKIKTLMMDEDVTKKSGIYEFLLSGNERALNIRAFSSNQKREAYERQDGRCIVCKEKFELEEMEADHITPWCSGGKTIASNCQMLCKHDNRVKSGI